MGRKDTQRMSRPELEYEVRSLRAALEKTLGAGETISYESGVNARGVPFVTFAWGDELAQIDPSETRQMALGLLETAEAAESDAAMVAMLTTERMGYSMEEAAQALVLLRHHRDTWKAIARGDQPPPPLERTPDGG